MAYDEATDQIIMFGGYSGPEDRTGDYHDDTWAYDAKANAWTKLEPSGAVPPARAYHTMAYDPVTQRTIMFGEPDESASSPTPGRTTPRPTPGPSSSRPALCPPLARATPWRMTRTCIE